jgi:signal peptidase I
MMVTDLFLGAVFTATVLGGLALHRAFFLVRVAGPSMEPTLRAGDRLLVRRVRSTRRQRGRVGSVAARASAVGGPVAGPVAARAGQVVGPAAGRIGPAAARVDRVAARAGPFGGPVAGPVAARAGQVAMHDVPELVASDGRLARTVAENVAIATETASRPAVFAGRTRVFAGRTRVFAGRTGAVAGRTRVVAGRICVVADDDGTLTVKRAAAVPGDPIPAEVPALRTASQRVVPAGHLVLLGDNRAHSHDSRSLGYYRADRLLGVVSLVVRPVFAPSWRGRLHAWRRLPTNSCGSR